MSVTGKELNECAGDASCIAVRMYNIIRDVGYGKLTADNALHRLIEDMKNVRDLSDRLIKLSNSIPWDLKETEE